MQSTWTAVDDYFAQALSPSDDALNGALARTSASGMPAISVTASQGKLLQLLAHLCGARRILEVGTLGGYSTIWMARALPADGLLVTLEIDPGHADIARTNVEHAGLASRVDVRVGAASASMASMIAVRVEPFDLIFIDADKANIPQYVRMAIDLARVGTVIVIDNVVRDGAVVDATSTDASVLGVRHAIEMIAHNPRLTATAIQTVGSKGYDGFLIALVSAATGNAT